MSEQAAYSFRGTWTVAASVDRVQAVLVDLERYPEWWSQVLAVAKLGDDDARVLCRSALPYTLDLYLQAVRRDAALLEVSLTGDLEGSARWELQTVPAGAALTYTQEVGVGGRLAALSRLVRPVLRWNHERMMAGCVAGLRARLSG